ARTRSLWLRPGDSAIAASTANWRNVTLSPPTNWAKRSDASCSARCSKWLGESSSRKGPDSDPSVIRAIFRRPEKRAELSAQGGAFNHDSERHTLERRK